MAREVGEVSNDAFLTSAAAQENGERQCYICLQSEGPELIAPCQCTGSMKWVHRPCLNRWRVSATNQTNFTNCRHCNFAFVLSLKRTPTEDEAQIAKRRRRFLFKSVSHFVLVATLIQIGLVSVAILVRWCDPKEKLVTFFDFPQRPGTPPAGQGNFWDAFEGHKTTYYVAACLVVLFVTGVVGTFICCAKMCKCSVPAGPTAAPCGDCCAHSTPFENYMMARACGDCCEMCGDCCYFCGRCDGCQGVDCNCGDCASSCDLGSCGDCGGSNNNNPCAAILGVLIIAVVVVFVLIGLFYVMAGLVMWIQKVATRYFQITELRLLTGEYVVEDLSHYDVRKVMDVAPSAPAQQDMASAPPPTSSMCYVPTTQSQVQQSLMRDMQAVYGLSASFQRDVQDAD